jgi:hypothetical protein
MAAVPTKKTWQERNALAASTKPALAPPPPLVIPPYKPVFAALEAETMGVYGTSKDGFDDLFNPLVAAVPAHAAQLALMDKDLLGARFTPGLIVKTIYNPIGAQIVTASGVGSTMLAGFFKDAGFAPPAAPSPGPSPSPTPPKRPIIINMPPGYGGNGGCDYPEDSTNAVLALQSKIKVASTNSARRKLIRVPPGCPGTE